MFFNVMLVQSYYIIRHLLQTAKAKLMQFRNLFSQKKHHGLQNDEARVTLEYCSSQRDTRTRSSRQRERGKGSETNLQLYVHKKSNRKKKTGSSSGCEPLICIRDKAGNNSPKQRELNVLN